MSNIKRILLPGCLFIGVMIFIAFPFRNRIIHQLKALIWSTWGGSNRGTGVCYAARWKFR